MNIAKCVLCGEMAEEPVFQACDRLYGISGKYAYAKCPRCKLLYLMSKITREDIGKLYPSSYVPHSYHQACQSFKEPDIEQKKVKRSMSLRLIRSSLTKLIREHFINRLKGTRIKRDVYNRLNSSSRVLDVGCGSGEFLYKLKVEKGCRVFGVDMSEQAVKTANKAFGLKIDQGWLEEMSFPEASFDLITAWWFLEHVPNPKTVLNAMNKLLKEDGDLIIGIPNSNSVNTSVFRDRWYHLDCPRHFNLWTPDTFKEMLALHGLTATRIVYDKTPWGLLGSLQYVFFGNNYTSRFKNMINHNPILYLLFLPWTIIIGLLGKADIMVFYCKKNV